MTCAEKKNYLGTSWKILDHLFLHIFQMLMCHHIQFYKLTFFIIFTNLIDKSFTIGKQVIKLIWKIKIHNFTPQEFKFYHRQQSLTIISFEIGDCIIDLQEKYLYKIQVLMTTNLSLIQFQNKRYFILQKAWTLRSQLKSHKYSYQALLVEYTTKITWSCFNFITQ